MLAKGTKGFFRKIRPQRLIFHWLILPEIAEGLPLSHLFVSLTQSLSLFLMTQAALSWFK